MSRTKERAPERGTRIDGFVRLRWDRWLRLVMAESIAANALARELASDKDDIQTWPRAGVAKWFNEEITVSAEAAFAAGAALARLGAPVSGPEAVFAAGHAPAFIAFCEQLAGEDGGAPVAGRLAVLMFAAFAFGVPSSTLRSGDPMLPLSRLALDELRGEMWPHEVFATAWRAYSKGKAPARAGRTVFDGAIARAYKAASDPNVEPNEAAQRAFSEIADWLLALPIATPELERLLEMADQFEDFCVRRRRQMRREFLRLRVYRGKCVV